MESKKNAFSLLPRRMVVSGFGFCVLASSIFFAITLLYTLKPSSFGTAIFSVKIENYEGLNENKVVQDDTHVLNFSNSAQIDQFYLPNGEGVVLKNTHLVGNFTDMVSNGSEEHNSLSRTSVNFTGSNGEEIVTEKKLHFGNISDIMFNGTFLGQEGRLIGKVSGTNSSKEDISSKIEEVTDLKENSFGKSLDSGKNVNEKMGKDLYQACDVYDGRWARDDTKPYYRAGSCPHIGRDVNCYRNGRPDDGFLRWRWQPNGCDIPSLNATDFLERLRGQKLVFVGDSLNRNMWESLVCILRHSIRHKKRVYEISGKNEFKKKGTYAFRFEDYNCSVDFVGAPFLVRESSSKGKNGTFETLRLDLMDKSTSAYQDADVLVFNSGHWWTHEKTSRGEGYYQQGNYVHPRLDALVAYKRALITWARWIDKNIDRKKTQVFFRGYSMSHFRGGQWNSGGQCNKETDPIFNDTYLSKYPSKMEALQHVLKGMKTPVTFLNISRLTDYRKDGHPSIYREYKTAQERVSAERTQDCSHWCLPGVPDTWNELLYASLLKAGRGSWRS